MITVLEGKIIENDPIILASINNEGFLSIKEKGEIALTVDTGFIGGIAVPEKVISKLKVEFKAFQWFVLANGDEIKLKLYKGVVVINNKNIMTMFVEGDYLIGLDFLNALGNMLCFDFKREIVKLMI